MTLTLNPERELTTSDMLQDNELDIVSGSGSQHRYTDPGDDDDKMSGGELAGRTLRWFTASTMSG